MVEDLNMIYDDLRSSNLKKIEHFEAELAKQLEQEQLEQNN